MKRAVLVVLLAGAACAPDPPAAVVAVRAEGCGVVAGSGAFVSEGLVLTAAHTVAGAMSVSVDGAPASVTGFDPSADLALLAADGPAGLVIPLRDGPRPSATDAVAYVVREGVVTRVPVTIVRWITIAEGDVSRPGMELAGDIRPGDSGGAVVVGGELVGVVWARSSQTPGRAYAIDPVAAGNPVGTDPGRCTAG